jgi:hypothetical protein
MILVYLYHGPALTLPTIINKVYCMLVAGVALSAAACIISPATLVFVAAGVCVAK